ncbi:MAG: glycosyltransferase [Helicobacter sp.]|nr:glycosyltransferase [Helicobacter sp.]
MPKVADFKISIIIPVFNTLPYITRALESCVNQSFTDIGIIVVDDCGSDGAIEIAKEFAQKDKRIKIVQNPRNMGLLYARFAGAKAAINLNQSDTKHYLLFLDSDDFISHDLCENLANIVSKNEVDMVSFAVFSQNMEGKFSLRHQEKSILLNQREYLALTQSVDFCPWHLCSKLIESQVYFKAFESLVGFEDWGLTFAEDALVYFAMLPSLKNVYISTESSSGYFYCLNLNSATNTKTYKSLERNLRDEARVLGFLQQILKDNKTNYELKRFYSWSFNLLTHYHLQHLRTFYRLKYGKFSLRFILSVCLLYCRKEFVWRFYIF